MANRYLEKIAQMEKYAGIGKDIKDMAIGGASSIGSAAMNAIQHVSGSHVATAVENGMRYDVHNPLTGKTSSTLPTNRVMEKIHSMPDSAKTKLLAMKHGTKSKEYKDLVGAIRKRKFARGVAGVAASYGIYKHFKDKANQDQYYY